MIIGMKKILFLGTQEELSLFFEKAQKKGMIQFIPAVQKEIPKPREIQELIDGLKILKHYRYEESIYPEGLTVHEIVHSVLNLQAELKKLQEARSATETEMVKIQPLGEFSVELLRDIERDCSHRFHFYFVKRGTLGIDPELILINTDHEFDFYLGFSKDPIESETILEIFVNRSFLDLKKDWIEIKEQIKKTEASLKSYAPYTDFLKEALLQKINQHDLISAKEGVAFELDDHLFHTMAWVPENKVRGLIALTSELSVHFEEVQIEPGDRIPTYMENHGVGKIGEDLVHIYDEPSYLDKDPSRWILFSFALFFAMITSDAGYGFLYLIGALFARFKFPKANGIVKRSIQLVQILAVFSIFWGVMACSYFSIGISPDSFLSKISGIRYLAEKKMAYHIQHRDSDYQELVKRFPAIKKEDNAHQAIVKATQIRDNQLVYPILDEFSGSITLELSLLIGVIHISLSFLRQIRSAYAGLGWVLAAFGGYLYFPIYLKATSLVHFLGLLSKDQAGIIGIQLLYAGIGLAVILSIIQNKLKGIGEFLNAVQVFADVLSYIRLYALGLAGMILAATFNALGESVGFVFGTFFILLGHSVNIVLAIMAGVIHGLRLNFLEWYHYSFQGGGRLFAPLKLLKEK